MRGAGAAFRAFALALALWLPAGAAFAQAAPVSPPDRIAFKQDEGEFAALMWRVVLAMGVIAIAAVGAVYVIKRYGLMPAHVPAGSAGPLRVIQTLRIAPRVGLFVVQFGSSRVLIAHTTQGVSVLATEPAPPPEPK